MTHLDDQLNAVDVQAACRHVCGHQHVEAAAPEASQRGLTGRLGNVTMQGAAGNNIKGRRKYTSKHRPAG